MSVINQMLRDLDGRGKTLGSSPGDNPLHPGTQSVAYVASLPAKARPGRRMGAPLLLGGLLAAAGAVFAWQYGLLPSLPGTAWWDSDRAEQSVVQASAVAVSVPADPASAVSTAALASDLPASAAWVAAVQALDAPVNLRLDAQLDRPPVGPVVVREPKPVATTPAAKVGPSVVPPTPAVAQAAPAQTPTPANAPVSVAATVSPTVAPAVEKSATVIAQDSTHATAQRQVAAVRDALGQAQGLWSVGNQSGAVELLRDALHTAEKSLPQPGMDSTLVALVRELARMQLGMGRVAEAHELLVHFEGRLKANPETWALRANAAQRLGQHQDSVQSYMQALQARPNEQRWLLGLAVSLAAMGQTASANEVVERARAEGPINRDIAAYLRQMGVNLR